MQIIPLTSIRWGQVYSFVLGGILVLSFEHPWKMLDKGASAFRVGPLQVDDVDGEQTPKASSASGRQRRLLHLQLFVPCAVVGVECSWQLVLGRHRLAPQRYFRYSHITLAGLHLSSQVQIVRDCNYLVHT